MQLETYMMILEGILRYITEIINCTCLEEKHQPYGQGHVWGTIFHKTETISSLRDF